MEQKSTSQLMNVLKSSHMEDIPQYQQQFLQDVPVSFAAYMDELVKAKGLKRQDIFQRADLPQKYGYKLLTGESHTVDRDKLLAHLSCHEALAEGDAAGPGAIWPSAPLSQESAGRYPDYCHQSQHRQRG